MNDILVLAQCRFQKPTHLSPNKAAVRWIQYLCSLKYALNVMCITEFDGVYGGEELLASNLLRFHCCWNRGEPAIPQSTWAICFMAPVPDAELQIILEASIFVTLQTATPSSLSMLVYLKVVLL